MMSCFQSRRLSSQSSVWLLRCALIVAVICWFPLPERAPGPVCSCLPSTSPPTAARHPFPDQELPELYRFWVKRRRLQRLPYADAISKVGSCSTLNETERAIKHFWAAASCRRRAMSSPEPPGSLAGGRNVTLSNCPAPSACSISTPEASSLYATTTIPASAQRCRYQS